MIIDKSYFFGQMTIAQKNEAMVTEELNSTIALFENEYLDRILGYDLKTKFIAGLAETPTVDPKWVNLRDGSTYEYAGQPVRWYGFKFTQDTFKRSPIANYVYYKYMQNTVSQTTGLGEKQVNFRGSTNYNPGHKMTMAWNQMVEWNRSLNTFMQQNADVYPEYKTDFRNELFYPINQLGI